MKKLADWIVDKRKLVLIFVAMLTAVSGIGIFKTNINYDMSKYLPSDSSVKRGMGNLPRVKRKSSTMRRNLQKARNSLQKEKNS